MGGSGTRPSGFQTVGGEISYDKEWELFANTYEKDELVQAIIGAKVKDLQKLPPEILKQVKLFIRNLELKNSRLYVKNRIYVPEDKDLQLQLLQRHHDLPAQGYPR